MSIVEGSKTSKAYLRAPGGHEYSFNDAEDALVAKVLLNANRGLTTDVPWRAFKTVTTTETVELL